MSEFGKTSEEAKVAKTKTRYASDFVKLSSAHQTIIRVLDSKPEVCWQHYVPKGHHAFPKANAGKGMSFICPGFDTCPICAWNKVQRTADPKTKDLLKARKVFSFNVLDRTPIVVCPKCQTEMYEPFPAKCQCGEDVSNVDATPRNKIQIMQKGQRIIDQLDSFEKDKDLGDLGGYDIKLDTRGGEGETMTTCVPKQKTAIKYDEVLGADWESKKYNIKEVITPLAPEQISRILNGEDYFTVMGNKKG